MPRSVPSGPNTSSLISRMRMPNSLNASEALSVPSAPPPNPLSSKEKNSSTVAPLSANRLLYSPMLSRKSPDVSSPRSKPAVMTAIASSPVRPNSVISVRVAPRMDWRSVPNLASRIVAFSISEPKLTRSATSWSATRAWSALALTSISPATMVPPMTAANPAMPVEMAFDAVSPILGAFFSTSFSASSSPSLRPSRSTSVPTTTSPS